mgnify:CR=1 FL=1
MSLNNKIYDILKYLAQYVLPALGTLYFAIASIWGLPYGEEIVGTITAIDAFLGALLGISASSYKGDGKLNVSSTDDKDVYSLDLDIPLEELRNKKNLYLTIKQ